MRDLLAAQDWKASDQETSERMCRVMDRQIKGWLRVEDIEQFPCLDLRNIDRLWVKYSQGKFGFSVQKEIWQSCGSPSGFLNNMTRFGFTVGWRKESFLGMGSGWINPSFETVAPQGHLPTLTTRFGDGDKSLRVGLFVSDWAHLFSRVKTCRL
nr:GUN4 domain-containing protein [Leptolyngbya sp. 'hensonii']